MLKFVDEYRNTDLCLELADRIKAVSRKEMHIMEVCGGHTTAIRKNGIQNLVGKNINFLSGPGCPVCVACAQDIDAAVALAGIENVAVCSFGDFFYVSGKEMNLAKKRAQGADIRIVYSVYDALNFARQENNKNFVFISIGFETTAPTVAAAVMQAKEEGLKNFYILSLNKTMPNALKAVLKNKHSKINALICPGHVSTITGTGIYRFIVDEIGISCCVSGFEPLDIMKSIYVLVQLYEKDEIKLVNAYRRVVLDEGNRKAQFIMSEVFKAADAEWRGIGVVEKSGLQLRDSYKEFDAGEKFNINVKKTEQNHLDCLCGDILTGLKKPRDCKLFSKSCTPDEPKGACMVSSEGTCAAWYKYKD